MKTNKPFPVNKEEIALALLKKAALLSNSKQQLINKHAASLRALRLVQADRQQTNKNGGK